VIDYPKVHCKSATETFLRGAGVSVLVPTQYMDKWRLGSDGVRAVENVVTKGALGF